MCGVASRRKADELIRSGRVRVNGEVVRDLGVKVDTELDKVEVGGREVRPQEKVYLILNKPCCYLTQLGTAPAGKKTIEELIRGVPARVFPVGRLDYNTEGLLLLTNDGELANRVLHPRFKLPKVYRALVKGEVSRLAVEKMKRGANLEDGPAKPDSVRVLRRDKGRTLVEIVFHEGRKHLVKRFLSRFGHPVLKLRRVALGPLRLGKLPPGEWRELSPRELRALFSAVGLKYSS